MSLLDWWYIMLGNSVFNTCIWCYIQNKLAFLYVFTNIYRSTFPVMHFTNTCMFPICSPFIDRSLSTVSELAFAIQLINWFDNGMYRYIGPSMIGAAEISCWIGIITGISYWHMFEESLWCSYAIFLLWLNTFSDKPPNQKLCASCILHGYIIYMIFYDIPSYYFRPNATKEKILVCEHISTDMDEWKPSLIWMTGYFTVGSWVSLAIS